MYPLTGYLLILFLFLCLIHIIWRKKIIKQLATMACQEKCRLLNDLIMPLGYTYDYCQDAFSSTPDPWQRSFGYGRFYDKLAPHYNMIFDSLPIYFDYNNQTWLIEFWKGQYGIASGGEIGIYHSDRLLTESQRNTEIFQAVSDDELLPLSFKLNHKKKPIACVYNHHWWLTIFKLGVFHHPRDLSMDITIIFPDYEMRTAFTGALSRTLHILSEAQPVICTNGLSVSFSFDFTTSDDCGFFKKLYITLKQWKNLVFTKLFLLFTRPFSLSMDRTLYLFQCMPFIIRRLLTIPHYKAPYKKARTRGRR